jgi:hypothetical protein
VIQLSTEHYWQAWQTPSEQQAPHLSQLQTPVTQQPQSQPLQTHAAQVFAGAELLGVNANATGTTANKANQLNFHMIILTC